MRYKRNRQEYYRTQKVDYRNYPCRSWICYSLMGKPGVSHTNYLVNDLKPCILNQVKRSV